MVLGKECLWRATVAPVRAVPAGTAAGILGEREGVLRRVLHPFFFLSCSLFQSVALEITCSWSLLLGHELCSSRAGLLVPISRSQQWLNEE